MKKLKRSLNNRFIAGVIGGLGEYFAVDPVLLRLLFLVVVIFTGILPGLFIYILAVIIVPLDSIVRDL